MLFFRSICRDKIKNNYSLVFSEYERMAYTLQLFEIFRFKIWNSKFEITDSSAYL